MLQVAKTILVKLQRSTYNNQLIRQSNQTRATKSDPAIAVNLRQRPSFQLKASI